MAVCRFCSLETDDFALLWTKCDDSTLGDMIESFAGIQLRKGGAFPERICLDCIEMALDAVRFWQMVRSSERRLATAEQGLLPPADGCEAKVKEPTIYLNVEALEQMDECVANREPSVADIQAIEAIEYLEDDDGTSDDKSRQSHDEDDDSDTKSISIEFDTYWNDISVEPKTVQLVYKPKPVPGFNRHRCCSRKCPAVFDSREELLEHAAAMHAVNREMSNKAFPFECSVCLSRFETRKYLVCHLRRLIRDYRCSICNVFFDVPREKMKHMDEQHGMEYRPASQSYRMEDQPIKICCGCEARFETVAELREHSHSVHKGQQTNDAQERQFQCNVCFRYFKLKSSMRNHQTLVYRAKPFLCNSCGKGFSCRSKLANHAETHATVRAHQCLECGATFKSYMSLQTHLTIHEKRMLVCSECGLRFHKLSQLKLHMRHHSDEYNFTCPECPKKFRVKSNLTNHLKKHTGEKLYPCRYCDKRYTYVTDRKKHEMSHTGDYPYRCEGCGKQFTRPSLLERHQKGCMSIKVAAK